MNKKKLSVVMAGAMLATSVAPVLAAEVTAEETKLSEKSLLAKKVVDLAKTKVISTNKYIANTANKLVDKSVSDLMKENTSAYGIKVLDKDGNAINLEDADILGGSGNGFNVPSDKLDSTKTITYDLGMIESILTADELVKDMTVQVVERKITEFLGQIIPGTLIEATGKVDTYKVADFEESNLKKNIVDPANNDFVKEIKANKEGTGATVTLEALKNLTDEKEGNVTIELDTKSDKLNFSLPLDKDGKITEKVQECVGFATETTYQPSSEIKADPEVKSAYKMVDDSKKHEEETLLASDLYDGLALTARGTEIQTDIENAKKISDETGKALTVELSAEPTKLDASGVASFTVTYFASHKDNVTPDKNDKPSKVITVKSTTLKEIVSLHKMLKRGDYEVGIIAGANRYETAVNVAKKHKEKIAAKNATAANNIVLVNGESLVDGLAAAPLAAKLTLDGAAGTSVLLSKTDSLPKETKEYLENLVSDIAVSARKHVTINLVGGESVLSESLVDELKEMGFKVERFGGDNREETSLEVARELLKGSSDDNNALFVVGANGEADAMSIASDAAKNKTPIIVAKAGGLTKNAVRFIKSNAGGATGDVDVIGGESVVSKAEYDKIDEVTVTKVDRVAGENRFETNAKIIDKYASNISEVVLVKDGLNNKNELVDALSAANYAAGKPIVLATDKITDAQKNAVLNKKASKFTKLTQIGQGVARTTLESVAEFLGLSNVK